MSAAFTPGPWSFCWNVPDITKAEPTSGVAWPGKGDISQRSRIDVSGPNTLANARLIAATPEMYAALLEACLALETPARCVFNDNGDHTITNERLAPEVYSACYYASRTVKEALAKARGEQ